VFVITGDSMSMLTEAARLGRRIAVFPLPLDPRWSRLTRFRDVLQKLGVVGFERDLGAFHQWLYAHNRAVPAGQEPVAAAPELDDALDWVVERVRRLVAPADRDADELPHSGTEEPSR
jgi:hypothetical protein